MPSRVQARQQEDEKTIAFRLRASYQPRKFPSLYAEDLSRTLKAAAVGAPDDVLDSLQRDVLALLPTHTVLFQLALQRIGTMATVDDVKHTQNFCAGATAFRNKLVKHGVSIHVCSSTDACRKTSAPNTVIVASNAVAGTFPLSNTRNVFVSCCVCSKELPFSPRRHQLCACTSQIFCTDCMHSSSMPLHDCAVHDQQAREVAATLVLANDNFPFLPLVDDDGRIVSIASYRSFISLAHSEWVRFAASGLEDDNVKQFILHNTSIIHQSLDFAASALHRSASRLMVRAVDETKGSKSGINDRTTMAGVLMHQSSAFCGKKSLSFRVLD
jgi:hypothetical protein